MLEILKMAKKLIVLVLQHCGWVYKSPAGQSEAKTSLMKKF